MSLRKRLHRILASSVSSGDLPAPRLRRAGALHSSADGPMILLRRGYGGQETESEEDRGSPFALWATEDRSGLEGWGSAKKEAESVPWEHLRVSLPPSAGRSRNIGGKLK